MHPKQAVFHFTHATRLHEKFKVGCPLPKGLFFTSQHLTLVNSKNLFIDANIKNIQLWPDLSIKWVTIEGVLNIPLMAEEQLYVTCNQEPTTLKRVDWVTKDHDLLRVSTANGEVTFDVNQFMNGSVGNQTAVATIQSNVNINTAGSTGSSKISNVQTKYEVVFTSLQQPLLCKIMQTADLALDSSPPLNESVAISTHLENIKLNASIVIYFADTALLTNISVHNPNPLIHHNGQWDLGNENSVYVQRLDIVVNYDSKKQCAQFLPNTKALAFDSLELVQFSSGGDNWGSENHVNRNETVSLKQKGAVGTLVLDENTEQVNENRPSPIVSVAIGDNKITVYPKHFWEKYPTSINSNSTQTSVDFAGTQSECEIELQPGEIKSHDIAILFGEDSTTLDASRAVSIVNIQYVLNTENLEKSQAIPFINSCLTEHPLMPVVSSDGDVDWLAKRELVDEYGWRNFGDLYADHEAAEYTGDGIFVSHYNNQYDPLFGFVKQWMLTRNPYFKQLAEDLFDHIVNIDIYHTTGDKPEYNKGLFWHTDHYVPAKTAAHRTYSQHQEMGVYMDHAGGGGPGAHHCYSSGMALYYLMSGDERAKSVTVGLGEWMRSIYEGDGTFLGLILRAKNANHITIPFTKKLVLGAGTGIIRNMFTNAYPLDRGTGNYVNVLLDCFETTLQKSYVEQAEYVILNTINKNDDIGTRNFDDIENTWYYVVLLQSVAKYLAIVGQQISLESSTFVKLPRLKAIYDAFIHYVNYMADREQHYLANKEVLEYPNDTWTGQDLRKIHVLLCGYELTHTHKMLTKASQLSDVVYPALLASEECAYTRIQALIMQNYASQRSVEGSFGVLSTVISEYSQSEEKKSRSTAVPINKTYVARCFGFLKAYSIKKEINLLCVRIPAVHKVLKR